jgi:hypothetical protein
MLGGTLLGQDVRMQEQGKVSATSTRCPSRNSSSNVVGSGRYLWVPCAKESKN